MKPKLIIAVVTLVALLCVSCGSDGKLHGNLNAGVTGSVLDPKDAQFNLGGTIQFAKKPRGNSAATTR